MLFGHSHGNHGEVAGKTMDVGVDCNGYYTPYSREKVKEIMDFRVLFLLIITFLLDCWLDRPYYSDMKTTEYNCDSCGKVAQRITNYPHKWML